MHVLRFAGGERGDHLALFGLKIVDRVQGIVERVGKAGRGDGLCRGDFLMFPVKAGLRLLKVGKGVAVCLDGCRGNAHGVSLCT